MDAETKTAVASLVKWLTAATLVAVAIGIAILSRSSSKHGETPTRGATQTRVAPVIRPTMNLSLPELIDRYNRATDAINDGQTRIPDQIGEATRNEQWSLYQIRVHPTIAVTIEVSNHDGRPFSLGFVATPDTQERMLAMLGAMTAISATAFGKGSNAGSLLQICKFAAEANGHNASAHVSGLDVYCTVVNGAWMGGVAVPKT